MLTGIILKGYSIRRKMVGTVFSITIDIFTFLLSESSPKSAPQANAIQNTVKAYKQKLKQAAYSKMINFGKKLGFFGLVFSMLSRLS